MLNVYGLLIALAIFIGAMYCNYQSKKYGFNDDIGYDVVIYAVPLAIIFARLYYVVFSFDMYKNNIADIFRVWDGGVAIYGGLIGGFIGIYLLSKRKKLRLIRLLDLVAPILLLGQAIGRWGNFANKEAYGYLVESDYFKFFPFAVNINGAWHYASFFYESLWNFVGFLILLFNVKKLKNVFGASVSLYFLWYSIGRIFIEQTRTDSLMLFGVLRVSQVLSILIILILSIVWHKKTHFKCFYIAYISLSFVIGLLLFKQFIFLGLFWLALMIFFFIFIKNIKRVNNNGTSSIGI